MQNLDEALDIRDMEIENMVEVVKDKLSKGLHTKIDNTTILIKDMEDSHLRNSIRRGRLKGGPFWELELPYLIEELEKRNKMPIGG